MPETDEQPDRPHRWETWNRVAEGYAKLARYVAPAALRSLRLAESYDEVESAERVAERLFERLRARRIRPAQELRVAERGVQDIRDPRLLLQDGVGTCLDMATTYASMLDAAQIGTLLAVTRGHAFVVVTPARLQGDDERFPVDPISLDGFVQDPDEAEGVLLGAPGALEQALARGDVIVVDAVQALKGHGDFAAAKASAREHARNAELRLVDVPYLHGPDDRRPFDPTVDRPAIHFHVPADDTPFDAYPSHAATIRRLRRASGTIVLYAPSGHGKSRIAREIARDAALGQGWFLDASESKALMKSLADADRSEREEPAEQAVGRARLDREGFADNALALLGEVRDRWIVVLDNADGNPSELERWMPKPGDDQLVLITSTNRAWRRVPWATVVTLPPLSAEEIATAQADAVVDVTALAKLVGGRPLMLRAFQSLLRCTHDDAADVAALAPRAKGRGSDSSRGPATLWAAVRAAAGRVPELQQAMVRVAAAAAYLPPDHQPLAVFEALGPDAAGAVRFLVDHGLLTHELAMPDEDREHTVVRLHRLFGAAVRADLERSDPALCDELARRIASEAASRRLLDVRGDLATVERLQGRLVATDDLDAAPDPALGHALHGIAWLLELHGQTRESGEVYEQAQRNLTRGEDRAMVADCLQGRARIVNQHHQKDRPLLEQAVGWARDARQTLITAQGERANAYRCLAMEGLLLQKLAEFGATDEDKVAGLEEALQLIRRADRQRRRRRDVDPAELARSQFNLAGVRIRLAQRQPSRARYHLDIAEKVYTEVQAKRIEIYGREVHPHIAACVIGLGYVAYFRALLIPASAAERSRLLRIATDRTVESLRQRAALEGPVDLDETTKNAAFLTKVALARASSPLAPASTPQGIHREAMKELTGAAVVLETVPLLPSDGAGLAEAIERWATSPALERVVAEFGGRISPDLALRVRLAQLDAFSVGWDNRNGRERNLAATRQFAPVTRKVVLAAAEALNLTGSLVPRSCHGRVPAYDHVLILGGLVRGCFARPLRAAELLEKGSVVTRSVTALGAFREIKGDEISLVKRIVDEEVTDELHAMDAGVRNAFGVAEPVRERGRRARTVEASWRVREYVTSSGLPLRVVAAPSREPETRRADTADTYAWFATRLARLKPGQRILLVTTNIYGPYQHADALRMFALPYGVVVDVATVDPTRSDGALRQPFGPDRYLQEIRSTIRAMRRLCDAL